MYDPTKVTYEKLLDVYWHQARRCAPAPDVASRHGREHDVYVCEVQST